MNKKLLLSGLAAVALMVSACGGDTDTPASTPSPSTATSTSATTAAPSAEATVSEPTATETASETAAPETSEAAPTNDDPAAGGELPDTPGPVEPALFGAAIAKGMENVKTMRTTSTQPNSEPSVTVTDLSDRTAPVSYSETDMMGEKQEMVTTGKGIYSRLNGGEWEFQAYDQKTLDAMQQFGDAQSAEAVAKSYQSIELVDPATRQYKVLMDLSAALGGPQAEAGQGMPVTIYLDEQNRVIKQEIEFGGSTIVNEMEYDVDIDIPDVG